MTTEVALDPQQVPARAELLLAAEFGDDAPGRPIFGLAGPEDEDPGETRGRIKVGAIRTRRLTLAEASERPSGAVYGNPLQGSRPEAAVVPIGAAVLARTDIEDAHGWRVYRVGPAGAVMYETWIDHGPGNGELALAQLRAAAARSPEAALRAVLSDRTPAEARRSVEHWLAQQENGRRAARKPRSRAARRRWRRALARKDHQR